MHDIFTILSVYFRQYNDDISIAPYVDAVTETNTLCIPQEYVKDDKFTEVEFWITPDGDNKDLFQILNVMEITQYKRGQVTIPNIASYNDDGSISYQDAKYNITFTTPETYNQSLEVDDTIYHTLIIRVQVAIKQLGE